MRDIKILYVLLILTGNFTLMANDVSVSWLPSEGVKEKSSNQAVDKLLESLKGSLRVLSCSYDNAILIEKNSIDNDISGSWTYVLNAKAVNGEKDALDLTLSVERKGAAILSAGVAVAFDFYNWNQENYVMIPASVYNGNRNRIVNRAYATGLDREDLYRKDLPLTTCPLPQLSPQKGTPSLLEINSSNAATPAICFFDRKNKQAFMVLAEQGISINGGITDHGLIVEESPDRNRASLIISAPGVRRLKPQFIGFGASPDRGIEWKQGDKVELKLRIYAFKASSVTDLLNRFMTARKSVTGKNNPRKLIPFSEVIRLMTANIDERYYKGENWEFYCPENAEWISFGWIGGLMNTFPMLVLGDEKHRKQVFNTFDFAIPRAQGASGYFYGALNHDGVVFGREGYDEFPEIVLTRKNADVLFWMIKQFMLLKAQGHGGSIKPAWEENIKRLADAFVSTWKQHKHWGNFLNNKTGEIAVYNTTGGAMAIGGLALASDYFNCPEYLKIAMEAADFYYKEFLKSGITTGGSADVLQNADAETAVFMMTSMMTLYEYTQKTQWLDYCKNLADLCATWTVSYDYILPAHTPLAKLGAKLAGVVWASTQNKHGAPGFCTSSGDPLFKIYRLTGERKYAELMYDIAHAHAEGIQPNGKITERLTYCDADNRGSRLDGDKTGWTELNGALMGMELPGIYLRKDIDRLFVFDHVEVKTVKRSRSEIILQITNPTKYDASVSILAEDAKQAKKPLGYVSFLSWPTVHVKAGETTQYVLSNDY